MRTISSVWSACGPCGLLWKQCIESQNRGLLAIGQYRGQQRNIESQYRGLFASTGASKKAKKASTGANLWPAPGPDKRKRKKEMKERKKEKKERKEKYIRFPLSCKGGWLTPAPASRESGCTRYFLWWRILILGTSSPEVPVVWPATFHGESG